MESPAKGGASGCQAGRRDIPKFTRTTTENQFQPGSDECVWRLGNALRAGRIDRDSWAFGFTLSLLRHNKRRSWKPSAKQLHAMRNLVVELATPDAPLIDEDDSDEAA